MSNGFDRAPERYTQQDRETCDRIRDELGDEGYKAWCIGNAMKYEDRKGAKGDPEGDAEKARWFRQMAAHVDGVAEDPRAGREGFSGYSKPMRWLRNCWNCRYDYFPTERGVHGCMSRHKNTGDWVDALYEEGKFDEMEMPPRDVDGCPGWEPKP